MKSAPCSKESSSLSLSCTKISVGILTRLTSSACLNQVSKNIYASFFLPFLSSLLNPGTVGKATRDKSMSNTVQGKYLHSVQIQISQGLGKGSWTGSFSLIALPVLLHACGTRLSGSTAGKHLAPLCSVPAWSLWFLLCHPSHSKVSLSDCTLQYVVFNVKFEVQGFSSPYMRSGCLKAGVDLWLLIQGPNSAHSHRWTTEDKVQTSGFVCRYVESLWHIS